MNYNPFLPGGQAPQFNQPAGQPQFRPAQPIVLRSTREVASNGVKTLTYGQAGAGKTTLLSTLRSVVIGSAESGLLSLRRHNIPYVEIDSMARFDDFYQWTISSTEARQFEDTGLDSISEIAEACLESERKTSGKDPRKAYGEMAIQVMEKLRQFRDIPGRNIHFLAKQGRLTDSFTGGLMWGPMMPGQQLDQQLPYFTDEVFHLGIHPDGQGGTARWLRTQPDNQYQAKDRSGALAAWEPPDLQAIIDKIRRG